MARGRMSDEEPEDAVFPSILHLNVGGTRLVTTLETVRRYPESKLCKMFSGQGPIMRCDDGSFFIDRDGRYFHHILNFLRDGSPPLGITRAARLELLRESRFYGLRRLHEILGGTQDPRDPGCSTITMPAAARSLSPQKYDSPSSRFGTFQRQRSDTGSSFGSPKNESGGGSAELTLFPSPRTDTVYVRLRYGNEYSGDWIVSSPRNLPGVDYELHDACLAREPIAAMNKMTRAGFLPCDYPPRVPPVSDFNTDKWSIMMYQITRRWEASRELQQNGDASRFSGVIQPPAGSGAIAARANGGSGSPAEGGVTSRQNSRSNVSTPTESARVPLRRMQAWRQI